MQFDGEHTGSGGGRMWKKNLTAMQLRWSERSDLPIPEDSVSVPTLFCYDCQLTSYIYC